VRETPKAKRSTKLREDEKLPSKGKFLLKDGYKKKRDGRPGGDEPKELENSKGPQKKKELF